jgi:hypothetical protein
VTDPLLRMLWDVSDANTEIYMSGIVSDRVLVQFNKCIDSYFDIERLDPTPSTSSPASETTPISLVDLPETRLRALMKLHRKPQIQTKPEMGNILLGPLLLGTESDMEVHVCRCAKLMQRELKHIFPNMTNTESVLAIPTNQVCTHKPYITCAICYM